MAKKKHDDVEAQSPQSDAPVNDQYGPGGANTRELQSDQKRAEREAANQAAVDKKKA